jgi:hypothetical protein
MTLATRKIAPTKTKPMSLDLRCTFIHSFAVGLLKALVVGGEAL